MTARNVLIGAGADEVLGVVVAAFIEPGLRSAMFTPTFPMCAVYTEQRGGSVLAVPYDEAFSGPVDALIEAAQDAQLVFLCSPNNPSGTAFALDDLERIVAGVPCAVVVNEAYYEYHGVSALGLIARYPHLIILRTFSKAFGMAGVRVGYALADPRMIDLLNRLRPPNSVAYMSVLLAEAVLGHLPVVRQGIDAVLSERETLRSALEEVGLLVWPSRGNFLLARFPHKESVAFVHRHLVDRVWSRAAISAIPDWEIACVSPYALRHRMRSCWPNCARPWQLAHLRPPSPRDWVGAPSSQTGTCITECDQYRRVY